MVGNDKVAVFDFCETLIKFQTGDAFIDFVYDKTKSSRMFIIECLRRFVLKFRIDKLINILFNDYWSNKSLNKRIRIFELRGFDEAVLCNLAKSYYEILLKPNVIHEVARELINKKKEGYCIGLVSGGYDVYIHYFIEDYPVDFCISSKIQFKNNKATGKLDGADCMGTIKVDALNSFLASAPKYSIVYTDSISDLPLLLWASEGVVVSQNYHQEWINNYNFKEVIWKN